MHLFTNFKINTELQQILHTKKSKDQKGMEIIGKGRNWSPIVTKRKNDLAVVLEWECIGSKVGMDYAS